MRSKTKMGGVLLSFKQLTSLTSPNSPKSLFGPSSLKNFEVLDVSDVHIPRRTGVDGERGAGGSGLEFSP